MSSQAGSRRPSLTFTLVRSWISGIVLGPQQLTFWNEEEGFMTETTVTDVMTWGCSGKGSVPITVSVLNFDPTLGCDPATSNPVLIGRLSNLKVIEDAFAKIFNLPPDEPRVFFGFYPEEQMFGGHAQYFGTLHASPTKVFGSSTKMSRSEHTISDVYESLTDAVTNWAEQALLLAADRTPDDHVPLAMDKEIVGLVAALDVWWDHGGRFHQESRGGAGWWGWWDVWSGVEGQLNVGL
ncbi:hypothetical protein EDB83DRAFT_2655905 [Lactarius deliciosus]|nr:hypothetical protein EDB83DRAFT_2655905 [Lactarius deliciosus]